MPSPPAVSPVSKRQAPVVNAAVQRPKSVPMARSPIRVVFPETTALPPGGYQHSMFDIIEHLHEAGAEVAVYFAAHEKTPAYAAAVRRNLPARIVSLSSEGFRGWRHVGWVIGYVWKAWRFLCRERIDIVHASNETLLFWLLPCCLSGAMPIWNVRAEMPGSRRGRIRQWLHLLFCRGVIFVSDAVGRSVRRNGLPGRQPTAVIRNFVPRRLMDEPTASSHADVVTVSFVGRLDDPVKDVDRAIRIMVRVLSSLPNRVRFLVWGPCSPERRQQLEELVPDAIRGGIEFCGMTNDVSAIYSRTDVLLLTSRSEGSPRVIMEAGARGIPTVATKVGGVPELIACGHTGFLFETDTEGEACLRELILDERLRGQLGQNVRRHFRENLRWDRVIGQYIDFYRLCLRRETWKERSA